MKSLALVCVALLALASASFSDEDETAVLNSPFYQHAADFKANIQSLMRSNPTGRPRDINKAVSDYYRQAKSNLAAQRPTGRPFRSHKDRAEFNRANWLLDKHQRDARTQLRKWHLQRIAAARKAAQSGSKQADETEVMNSPFYQHAADFKANLQSLMRSNPTGRPRDINKAVSDYYKQAKSNLAAQRPTGRPFRSHKDRSEFNRANWLLEKQLRDARTQLRKWHLQRIAAARKAAQSGSKQADETEIISSDQFLAIAKSFFKIVQKKFAGRFTASADAKEYFKFIGDQFELAKNKMLALKSSKAALTGEEEQSYKQAYQRLVKYQHIALEQVKDWAKKGQ